MKYLLIALAIVFGSCRSAKVKKTIEHSYIEESVSSSNELTETFDEAFSMVATDIEIKDIKKSDSTKSIVIKTFTDPKTKESITTIDNLSGGSVIIKNDSADKQLKESSEQKSKELASIIGEIYKKDKDKKTIGITLFSQIFIPILIGLILALNSRFKWFNAESFQKLTNNFISRNP